MHRDASSIKLNSDNLNLEEIVTPVVNFKKKLRDDGSHYLAPVSINRDVRLSGNFDPSYRVKKKNAD